MNSPEEKYGRDGSTPVAAIERANGAMPAVPATWPRDLPAGSMQAARRARADVIAAITASKSAMPTSMKVRSASTHTTAS